MHKIISVFAIVATGIIMSGCASFQGKLLAPIQEFPPAAENRPSANIDLSFRQYMNDAPVYLMAKTAERALEKKCIKRFAKSGLYDQVGTDLNDADLQVTIELKDDGRGSMGMAFLTGLTFYIIPSFATDTYKLKADVTDRRDGTTRVVELEDFVTQYQQILLLPLLPFKMTPVVAGKVQNTLFDNLAVRVLDGPGKGELNCKPAAPSVVAPVTEAVVSQSISNQFKQLKELRESGVLTDGEYETKRKALLEKL